MSNIPSSWRVRRIPLSLFIVGITSWCVVTPAHRFPDLVKYSGNNPVQFQPQFQSVRFATDDVTAVKLSGTVGSSESPSVYLQSPLRTAAGPDTPSYARHDSVSTSDLRLLHWSQQAAQISGYDSSGEN